MTSPKNVERTPGESLGRYTPIATLGTGGMADIFLAVARGMEGFNKLAVVKRLRASSEEAQVKMFLDEARLAARLAHPNIVHTYEVGESKGSYFIAMEYLEGQPLNKVAALYESRGEGLPERLVAEIMALLLKALHYTHELRDYDGAPLGCVHRDVSPQNVFVTYTGEVKLLDFGIAKAALNTTVTEMGELKGKIRYMSPEQVAGGDVDRRADLYAAGVVMWELLARRKLYEGDAIRVMTRIANTEPPRVSSARDDCDPALDAIVARALRLDRSDRYATADEMRAELEAYLRKQAHGSGENALAGAMAELFRDARAEAQAQIQSFLAAAPSGDLDATANLPTFGATGDRPSKSATSRTGIGVLPIAEPSRRVGGSRIAIAGVVAAVIAAGVILSARRDSPSAPAISEPPSSAIAAPATFQAHLLSVPSGALVEWNGKPVDRTPATITLPLGEQTLTISRDGFDPMSIVVEGADGAAIVERTVELHARVAAAPSAAAPAPATPSVVRSPGVVKPRAQPSASSTAATPLRIRVVDDNP